MLSIQELRSSTQKELLAELKNASSELVKIRITSKTKSNKDTSMVTKQKRYVAQIKTIIKEIELEEIVKKATEIEK